MKLMINISEEDYETAKKVEALYGEWRNDVTSRSLKAIANGTPLPKGDGELIKALGKIRAKIEAYKSGADSAISEDEFKIEGLKEAYENCLEIIDRYTTESEEG